ncbi:MAG TPA: hypothetical protein VF881_17635, partial [Polyangiaceae bacterium]
GAAGATDGGMLDASDAGEGGAADSGADASMDTSSADAAGAGGAPDAAPDISIDAAPDDATGTGADDAATDVLADATGTGGEDASDSATAVETGTEDAAVDAGSDAADSGTQSKVQTLKVYDTANETKWAVQTDFEIGVKPWGDRTFTVASFDAGDSGATLLGKDWIQTANASKLYNPDSGVLAEATITLNGIVNVYLIVDRRAITAINPTMNGWTITSFHMGIAESATTTRPFDVYVKMAQTGNVDLPIQNSNTLNYFVILE